MTSITKKNIYINIGLRNRSYNYGWSSTTPSSFSLPQEIKCNSKSTMFKFVKHTVSCNDNFSLKFLIPSREKAVYKNLKLCENGQDNRNCTEEKIECKKGKNGEKNLYIYFYGDKDPRPLMFCYAGNAYRALNKGDYDNQKWTKDVTVMKCECSDTGKCDNCDELLKALNTVMGFLNTVDLSKHPTGTSKGCTNSGAVSSEGNTCAASTENNVNTCTYEVHAYNGSKILVRVTCTPVKGEESVNGKSCYKKLTHQPAGLSGEGATTSDGGSANGSGFRLGDIVYNRNGDSMPKGTIKYYPNGTENGGDTNKSDNWRKPLVKVEAYFYNEDTNYKDPLLVVLEFANGTGNDKECYKLVERSDIKMEWEKDTSACEKVGEGKEKCLVEYLDGIRYELKQVLQIKLEQNNAKPYPLNVKPGKSGAGSNGFGPLENGGSEKVEVAYCDTTCAKLKSSNYKCVVHRISQLGDDVLHKIGGVAFTIPVTTLGSENEIKLYDDVNTGEIEFLCEPIQLFYNSCMGNICVYFYCKDPRPLMLCYNGSAYAPRCMEEYYSKWFQVKDCNGKSCECAGGSCDGCEKLIEKLVEVSNFLNPLNIKFVPRRNYNCASYYVHEFKGQEIRIKVEKTTSASNSFCYNGYTHTHLGIDCKGEGFRLGNINYNGTCIKDISTNNGGGDAGTNGTCITSALENGNTYTAASEVVVYYYKEDTSHKNPLLVALCKNGKLDKCNLYYKLQKDDRVGSTVKKYIKGKNGPIDLSETSGSELEKKLDNIRYNIAITLQIIIDKRPLAKLYCPPPLKKHLPNGGTVDVNPTFKCQKRENGKSSTAGKTDSNEKFIPPSYQAQLYDSEGNPLPNRSATNTTTKADVKVTLIDCWQLTKYGYKCYEHKVQGVDGVEEIGGLKFYLWDNSESVCAVMEGVTSSLVLVVLNNIIYIFIFNKFHAF